jgi:hypothetical protein
MKYVKLYEDFLNKEDALPLREKVMEAPNFDENEVVKRTGASRARLLVGRVNAIIKKFGTNIKSFRHGDGKGIYYRLTIIFNDGKSIEIWGDDKMLITFSDGNKEVSMGDLYIDHHIAKWDLVSNVDEFLKKGIDSLIVQKFKDRLMQSIERIIAPKWSQDKRKLEDIDVAGVDLRTSHHLLDDFDSGTNAQQIRKDLEKIKNDAASKDKMLADIEKYIQNLKLKPKNSENEFIFL